VARRRLSCDRRSTRCQRESSVMSLDRPTRLSVPGSATGRAGRIRCQPLVSTFSRSSARRCCDSVHAVAVRRRRRRRYPLSLKPSHFGCSTQSFPVGHVREEVLSMGTGGLTPTESRPGTTSRNATTTGSGRRAAAADNDRRPGRGLPSATSRPESYPTVSANSGRGLVPGPAGFAVYGVSIDPVLLSAFR
jgi:hypothetical protein